MLTEGDYALWPAGSWQDQFMRDALDGGACVFLGLSFTDQNLLRWIYRSTGNQHVAVLARQSSPRLSDNVRSELEAATLARLQRAHVGTYWADFYAEVAQLLHEARRRRGPGKPRVRYPERAQNRVLKGRRRCLPASGLETRQRKVREILSEWLAGVRAGLDSVGIDPGGAALGLGSLGPRLRATGGNTVGALRSDPCRQHDDHRRPARVGIQLGWDRGDHAGLRG